MFCQYRRRWTWGWNSTLTVSWGLPIGGTGPIAISLDSIFCLSIKLCYGNVLLDTALLQLRYQLSIANSFYFRIWFLIDLRISTSIWKKTLPEFFHVIFKNDFRWIRLELKYIYGMGWRGRWEGGSGGGTHVYPWQIQVNVWQNQYNIVK